MSATAAGPDLMSLSEAATRLGLHESTVRRAIRQECDERLADTVRTVPGGRVAGERYLIFRRVFDAVVSEAKHVEPEATPIGNPFLRRVS